MSYDRVAAKDTWSGVVKTALGRTAVLDGLSEDTRARVRARQVFAISRLTIPMMLANIANALALLVVMEVSEQSSWAVWTWTAIAVSFALYTCVIWYRRRHLPFPERLGRRTSRKVVANAFLLGAIWTIPGLFFLPHATGSAQSFLVALAAGMIAGGAMALYPLPAAAITYSAVIAFGSFLGFSTTGDATLIGFAIVTVAFYHIVANTITRHSDVFVSEFVGRLELDEKNALIERLLEEVQSEANDERIRSERRLAQAQKMEAIGQLTGGIAHDFNNLLAAIQGHAELIQLERKADPALTVPILRSTARGSELVRGLLSIARKQPLKSESVDVGRLIEDMAPLLARTLGGRIVIEQSVPVNLWQAFVDIGHLESAVLNLALNARDAMPNGGVLTLKCENATSESSEILKKMDIAAGEFVQLSITDNGQGMTPAVKQRATEPFFTTKKVGDGSGLGLATIEGFCGQSGGHLWIDSNEGSGTVVFLFLPRARDAAVIDDFAADASLAIPGGHGEHILVVEDDEDVRQLAVTMLEGLNYHATWTATADAAWELVQSGSRFDLILADVRLPGRLNGLDLADRLEAQHPEIRTVVYSGYPEVDDRQMKNIGYPFLRKPFSRRELALIVASALMRQAGGASASS